MDPFVICYEKPFVYVLLFFNFYKVESHGKRTDRCVTEIQRMVLLLYVEWRVKGKSGGKAFWLEGTA